MRLFTVLVLAAACNRGEVGFDARVTPLDAPSDTGPPPCAVMKSLGGFMHGTPTMPIAGNYFVTPSSGPNVGKLTFKISGTLPSSTQADADILEVELVSENGVFPTNTDVSFDPGAGAASGTTPYVAAASIKGDVDGMTSEIQNFYWASSGSITITQIGATSGSSIKGSVNPTAYVEVDPGSGTPVISGCTTMLTQLKFDLIQQ